MMLLASTFGSALAQIKAEVFNTYGGFLTGIAGSLAAALAGYSIMMSVIEIMGGKEIKIWPLVKPFAIAFLVCNFNLVLVPIDATMGAVTNGIVSAVGDAKDMDDCSVSGAVRNKKTDIFGRLRRGEREDERKKGNITGENDGGVTVSPSEVSSGAVSLDGNNAAGEAAESSDGWLKTLLKNINSKIGISSFFSDLSNLYLTQEAVGLKCRSAILMDLTESVFFLSEKIMFCVSTVYLIIVGFLGPFVFALSLFPGFGGISTWIARYVQVSFWGPIISIVRTAYLAGMNTLLGGLNVSSMSYESLALGCSLSAAFTIACIALVFAAPKLAMLVVQSTGFGGAHDNLARGARSAGSKAVKVFTKV